MCLESDVGEERKAEIALTDLNKLVEEFMPIIEKGKNSVNESWYSFKIPQFPYPTFSVDSMSCCIWVGVVCGLCVYIIYIIYVIFIIYIDYIYNIYKIYIQ